MASYNFAQAQSFRRTQASMTSESGRRSERKGKRRLAAGIDPDLWLLRPPAYRGRNSTILGEMLLISKELVAYVT
jgi:hypothetical protein